MLGGLAAGAAAAMLGAPAALAQAAPRVVVIGGGFAGASFARALKREDAAIAVTLVEPNARYTACPLSNAVIAGLREIGAQQFGYDGLAKDGITPWWRRRRPASTIGAAPRVPRRRRDARL